MTSRTTQYIVTAIAAIVWSGGIAEAQGRSQDRGNGQPDAEACRKAAKIVADDDTARGRSGEHRQDERYNAEARQVAAVRLLTCGASGGTAAAATILFTTALTDTTALEEAVGPYRNLRDTAVFNASMTVAGDPSASVQARIFAIRTLWVLRTGKFWIGYGRMLPTSDATAANPVALCDDGPVVDAQPFWFSGATLPAGFDAQIVAFAAQLVADASQPLAVRVAASCATR